MIFNLFNLGKKAVKPIPGGIKPVVLLILDGFGIAPESAGNAITLAKPPNINRYLATYPHGELIAAGESVGLPANEAGNSEVGHLTIGAGRIILQSLPRINKAIKEGDFLVNDAFLQAVEHVKKGSSKLHIMGMVSTGQVHSSLEHFWSLLEFCKKQGLTNVVFHLFTDGRDAPPTNGITVIKQIEEKLKETKVGSIATVMGRYWAMDRDGRWERTQKAYEAIVLGRGLTAASASQAVQNSYNSQKTDEFIEPTIITQAGRALTVDNNDAVIFFNFRIDRPRQLTMAFVFPNFETVKAVDFGYIPHEEGRKGKVEREQTLKGSTFKREKVTQNVFFVTMTEYQKNLPVSAIAFPPPEVKESLPEILAQKGLKQLHLAESEKERMVTFYFNGTRETRFPGEEVAIVSSPNVATYDKKPQMSVFKVVEKFKAGLAENKYHFFVLNFANPDMVAHSGDLKATIKAIEAVDQAVGDLVDTVLAFGGTVVITADHGNAEELLSFPTKSFYVTTAQGEVDTEHSGNPVPALIINGAFQGKVKTLAQGTLSDVAPTILALMGIPKPAVMTGRNLLE
jgi:2,3-bisphosphoglycerate-independent phosphoglycerate mutase